MKFEGRERAVAYPGCRGRRPARAGANARGEGLDGPLCRARVAASAARRAQGRAPGSPPSGPTTPSTGSSWDVGALRSSRVSLNVVALGWRSSSVSSNVVALAWRSFERRLFERGGAPIPRLEKALRTWWRSGGRAGPTVDVVAARWVEELERELERGGARVEELERPSNVVPLAWRSSRVSSRVPACRPRRRRPRSPSSSSDSISSPGTRGPSLWRRRRRAGHGGAGRAGAGGVRPFARARARRPARASARPAARPELGERFEPVWAEPQVAAGAPEPVAPAAPAAELARLGAVGDAGRAAQRGRELATDRQARAFRLARPRAPFGATS